LEICADLLHAAEGGARKTQLVYRANLNFSIIGRYLSVLTKNGLLDADPPLYVATEKGKEFLRLFDLMLSCMGMKKDCQLLVGNRVPWCPDSQRVVVP